MKTFQLKCLAWTFSAFLPHSDNKKKNRKRKKKHSKNNNNNNSKEEEDETEETPQRDYYEILGISKKATPEEIRKAYKQKSLLLHPDKVTQRRNNLNHHASASTMNTSSSSSPNSANNNNNNMNTTDEEEARQLFQEVKESYEILSNPAHRQVYDALGKDASALFTDDATSLTDPRTLLKNLSHSNVCDRSKLMVLLVLIWVLVGVQPVLVCWKLDQMLGGEGVEDDGWLSDVDWMVVLIPLWCWNVFTIVWSLISFDRIKRQKKKEEEEKVRRNWDGLVLVLKLILIAVAEVFLALKFDGVLSWKYVVLFVPIYLVEGLRLVENLVWIRRVHSDVGKMVTVAYLEKEVLPEMEEERMAKLNEEDEEEEKKEEEDEWEREKEKKKKRRGETRKYGDLTDDEKDVINEKFIIVHVPHSGDNDDEDDDNSSSSSHSSADTKDVDDIVQSPEYKAAIQVLYTSVDVVRNILFVHVAFLVLLVLKLDYQRYEHWNWFVVFIPLWINAGYVLFKSCFTWCFYSPVAPMAVSESDGDDDKDDDKDDDDVDNKDDDDDDDGDEEEGRRASTASAAAASSTPNDPSDTKTPPAAAFGTTPSLTMTSTDDDKDKEDEQSGKHPKTLPDNFKEEADIPEKDTVIPSSPGSTPPPTADATTDVPIGSDVPDGRVNAYDTIGSNGLVNAYDTLGSDGRVNAYDTLGSNGRVNAYDSLGSDGRVNAYDTSNTTQNDDDNNEEDADADDDDDDSDIISAFNEDFIAWQQAQAELDAAASEARARAASRCCVWIFLTTMLILFVFKLNAVDDYHDMAHEDKKDGDDSFSTFWIISPVLFVMGLVFCCCCCGIYCAADLEKMEEIKRKRDEDKNDANDHDNGDAVDNDDDDVEQGNKSNDKPKTDDPIIIPMPPPPVPTKTDNDATGSNDYTQSAGEATSDAAAVAAAAAAAAATTTTATTTTASSQHIGLMTPVDGNNGNESEDSDDLD